MPLIAIWLLPFLLLVICVSQRRLRYLLVSLGKFFLFLHKNLCCGYSLEAPQLGTSNEYPKDRFLSRIGENYPRFIIKYSFTSLQGPVVQSIVSLTSSLRVISLTVVADSIYNNLIFFAEKMRVAFALQKLLTFFQQTILAYLRITRCKF